MMRREAMSPEDARRLQKIAKRVAEENRLKVEERNRNQQQELHRIADCPMCRTHLIHDSEKRTRGQ